MSEFDRREKAYESKFAHDEELKFKATARRNKLLGRWAADLMGLTGDEAEHYAKGVVLADLEEPGEDHGATEEDDHRREICAHSPPDGLCGAFLEGLLWNHSKSRISRPLADRPRGGDPRQRSWVPRTSSLHCKMTRKARTRMPHFASFTKCVHQKSEEITGSSEDELSRTVLDREFEEAGNLMTEAVVGSFLRCFPMGARRPNWHPPSIDFGDRQAY